MKTERSLHYGTAMNGVLLSYTVNEHARGLRWESNIVGARCSSVVRVFAHGAMGRRIDPSW